MLTALAVTGYLEYDVVRFVSLLISYPTLPLHTVRNSLHCDSATVPSEGEGMTKFVYRDPSPLSAPLLMFINRENVGRIQLARDIIQLFTNANAVRLYRGHSHCQSFP